MPTKLKKVLMIAAGVVFMIFGLIGFALPFLQGFLFLAIGIVLLSLASSKIRTWMEAHTRPYPRMHNFVNRIQKWVIHIIGPTE
jgi:uncharacterized membrane protein YbaN (DUF454 family)